MGYSISQYLLVVVFCLCFSLEPIIVDPQTRFFIEKTTGRRRLFHGLNAVYKIPPYYPSRSQFDVKDSICDEDIANLKKWGFNVIRLGVLWNAVVPTEGQINSTYLSTMFKLVKDLESNGIYTMVDMHQDTLGAALCGEGFPKWAVAKILDLANFPKNSTKAFPAPFKLNITFGPDGYPDLQSCVKNNFFFYYLTEESCAAWGSFYNHSELWADFGFHWRAVASVFNETNGVLGYELLNEPWAGDLYHEPLRAISDKAMIEPLYKVLHKQIRSVDDNHIVFYEPLILDSYLDLVNHVPDITSGPGGPTYNDRQALAYHIYCPNDEAGDPVLLPVCHQIVKKSWDIFNQTSRRIGGGYFLTEFGATGNDKNSTDFLDTMLNHADAHLASWTYWTWKSFEDITTENPQTETLYEPDGSLQMAKLSTLSRTYAQAIAGHPIDMSYDPHSSEFRLDYMIVSGITGMTEIYFNEHLHYSNGFTVSLQPKNTATWHQQGNIIFVTHTNAAIPGIVIKVTVFKVRSK